MELDEGSTGRNGSILPRAPSLDEAHTRIRRLSLQEGRSGHSFMLKPPRDVLPGDEVLVLLLLGDNLGRTSNVLLLNHSLPLAVLLSHCLSLLLRHRDHLHGLLVLSLTPLAKGRPTIPLPVHSADKVELGVLRASEVLVTGELSNVLESALPERPRNDFCNAV